MAIKPQRQWAIAIHHNGTVSRWWSGSGELELNGETYGGTFVRDADGNIGSAIALEAPENIAGEVGNRCRFSIAVVQETIRRAFSLDLGPVECEIYWIYPEIGTAPGEFAVQFSTQLYDADNVLALLTETLVRNINQYSPRPPVWRTRTTGSTPSSLTGPGSNNTRNYVFYESSGTRTDSLARSVFSIDGGTAQTPAVTSWINAAGDREIRLTASLQGFMFSEGTNGLWLWSSANDPNFTNDPVLSNRQPQVQALLRTRLVGWAYRDDYVAGQTITDYAGEDFICAANGGWRDFTVTVPANHRHFGFAVDLSSSTSGFRGDAAISSIEGASRTQVTTSVWSITDQFVGNLSAPTINVKNATYSADVEGEFGRFGRGRLRKWSDTNQQADYPADRCFENVELIQRGQVRIRW